MSDDAPETSFGTSDPSQPVTRRELERALRFVNLAVTKAREDTLRLAAQVVALTDELTRRIDGLEPEPAPPGTPAPEPTATVEAAVGVTTPMMVDKLLAADETSVGRVVLGPLEDKYAIVGESPPCEELLPLCRARCCKLLFALSTQDLDEGIIKWDYGEPYLIRHRESDRYCVHNHPEHHYCTVHVARPAVCRGYTCKNDKRIWADFDRRIPADAPGVPPIKEGPLERPPEFDLMERMRQRQLAITFESSSLHQGYTDPGPTQGPAPRPAR